MQHANIKFTFEIENDNSIPFLDIMITKTPTGLATNVYRKPTHTDQGLHWFSFCPNLYKINSIKTLLNRAYSICSNNLLLHQEFKKLENYFLANNYCYDMFQKVLKVFLWSKYKRKEKVFDVPKLVKYIKLPFLGKVSYDLRKQLNKTLQSSFPAVNFRIIFSNELRIRSFFRVKDIIPDDVCSNIVYKFECPCCPARYVGCSSRSFRSRIFEHIGKSVRTGRYLNSMQFSAIRNHSLDKDHRFSAANFKIIGRFRNKTEAFIGEQYFIEKIKPDINIMLNRQLDS